MDITSAILIVLGLVLFESITSIDNAIINAEVLASMKPPGRRWFLTWGILLAVFGIPGRAPLAHRLGDGARPGALAGFHGHLDRRPCGSAGDPPERADSPVRGRGFLLLPFLPLAFPGAQEIWAARRTLFRPPGGLVLRRSLGGANRFGVVCDPDESHARFWGGGGVHGVLHHPRV